MDHTRTRAEWWCKHGDPLTTPDSKLLGVTRISLTWNIPSGSSSSVWVDSKQNTLRLGTSIRADRSSRSWSEGRDHVAKQVDQTTMSPATVNNCTAAPKNTTLISDISLIGTAAKEQPGKRKTDGTTKGLLCAVSATPRRKTNKIREQYTRGTMRGCSTHVAGQQRDSPRSACQTFACA